MIETQKPSTKHWASEKDIPFIAQLFSPKKNKRLIWAGHHPDGKKNIRWENLDINWQLHLTGQLKQGANLCFEQDGKKLARAAVVDLDQEVPAKEICSKLFSLDSTVIPIKSPSGRWHAWKFFNNVVDVKEAAQFAKDLGHKIAKLNYNVDFGKCNPRESGADVGINLPFHSKQLPYDPRGNQYSFQQFKHRLRFNNFPYIAAATNLMTGKGRYDALLIAASILHQSKKYKDEYIDEIVKNFGTPFDDIKRVERLKEKQEYKKYEYNQKNIDVLTGELFDYQDFKSMDLELAVDAEPLEALELIEYTGNEKLKAREWVVKGWLLKKALTLVVGQAGVGKTMFLAQLATALAYGGTILGKEILETGNVLILASEETQNEIKSRIKAIEKFLELEKADKKIYLRGLDEQIKLVNFTTERALQTKEYKQLQLAIKKYEIKHILIDPLISFQTGAYDENNNAKMEQFAKDFVIPLAVKNNGTVIAGHHTNKFSMIQIEDDGELVVDHQIALNAARGASSLVGAARFVLAFQPMTKKVFEKKFKQHLKDGSRFTHYAGLIEAKSNYNIVEDDINWLKKNSVSLEVVDTAGNKVEESLGVFSTTDLNKITRAKNKLKAEQNENYVRSNLHIIKTLMVDDECTLNAAVEELLTRDPAHADPDVEEATIKTRIRRQLENGLSGKVDSKNGLASEGISFDDGYNYWIKRDHTKKGAAKVFIQRGKDFKR